MSPSSLPPPIDPPRPPPTEAQLMLVSAFLDGELSPAQESELLDALSQDPYLLNAFEALSATFACQAPGGLSTDDADHLLASVMAATSPEAMSGSLEGALQLAQLAVDGNEDARQSARLEALLHEPGAAAAVAGFVVSIEAAQAALRAAAAVPFVVESLRALPDHIDALLSAEERLGVLASTCLDDALAPDEAAELDVLLPRDADDLVLLAATAHAGEALRAAAMSPAFARLAHRAGDAALHSIEATSFAERTAAGAKHAEPSLFARFSAVFSGARVPLALAGAAFAVFFAVSSEAPRPRSASEGSVANEARRKVLLDAMEAVVLAEAPASGDLPLLDDNTADVEAIDATGNTMVFATASSKITVIWLASTDEEQGT